MNRIRATLVLALLVVAAVAGAQALAPFTMTSVSLYQGDAVLKQRLGPQGAKALATYIDALNGQAVATFGKAARHQPFSGAIVVAVKPGRQARFWIVSGGPAIDPGLVGELQAALSRPPPIEVQQGPFAVALLFDAWGGGTPVVSNTSPYVIPDEWIEAQRDPRAVGPVPDGPLAVLWPDE